MERLVTRSSAQTLMICTSFRSQIFTFSSPFCGCVLLYKMKLSPKYLNNFCPVSIFHFLCLFKTRCCSCVSFHFSLSRGPPKTASLPPRGSGKVCVHTTFPDPTYGISLGIFYLLYVYSNQYRNNWRIYLLLIIINLSYICVDLYKFLLFNASRCKIHVFYSCFTLQM